MGRKLMLASLVAGGGFLFGTQSTSCLSFAGESFLASGDFCFIFDCQNGLLGGTIDPCTDEPSSGGTFVMPGGDLFTDCP